MATKPQQSRQRLTISTKPNQLMKTYASMVVLALSLSACSSSKTIAPIGATRDVASIDAQITSGRAPDADSYALARQTFVDEMTSFIATQRSKANSSGRTIRSAISGVGSILGVGGLVASLIVSDEDTRSSIAQVSGGVASVSGIVGLIPMGGGATGAKATVAYLEQELPRFESRWPATRDSIDIEAWSLFAADCVHIESVAAELRTVE